MLLSVVRWVERLKCEWPLRDGGPHKVKINWRSIGLVTWNLVWQRLRGKARRLQVILKKWGWSFWNASLVGSDNDLFVSKRDCICAVCVLCVLVDFCMPLIWYLIPADNATSILGSVEKRKKRKTRSLNWSDLSGKLVKDHLSAVQNYSCVSGSRWDSGIGTATWNRFRTQHSGLQLMLQVLGSTRLILKSTHINQYVLTRAKSTTDTLPLPPPLSSLTNSDESNEARKWIAMFKSESILRGSVELSFSRSSGPGGQVCSTCSKLLCKFCYRSGG